MKKASNIRKVLGVAIRVAIRVAMRVAIRMAIRVTIRVAIRVTTSRGTVTSRTVWLPACKCEARGSVRRSRRRLQAPSLERSGRGVSRGAPRSDMAAVVPVMKLRMAGKGPVQRAAAEGARRRPITGAGENHEKRRRGDHNGNHKRSRDHF